MKQSIYLDASDPEIADRLSRELSKIPTGEISQAHITNITEREKTASYVSLGIDLFFWDKKELVCSYYCMALTRKGYDKLCHESTQRSLAGMIGTTNVIWDETGVCSIVGSLLMKVGEHPCIIKLI